MVTAIILLKADRRAINNVAEHLASVDGVSEVYSVGGRYDLIAIVRVAHNDDLAELVTGRLREIDGITDTETMLAFRAHSRHDLETMFSVGL
jgi:DNA-binding Lrp family transcriptional regulator